MDYLILKTIYSGLNDVSGYSKKKYGLPVVPADSAVHQKTDDDLLGFYSCVHLNSPFNIVYGLLDHGLPSQSAVVQDYYSVCAD